MNWWGFGFGFGFGERNWSLEVVGMIAEAAAVVANPVLWRRAVGK